MEIKVKPIFKDNGNLNLKTKLLKLHMNQSITSKLKTISRPLQTSQTPVSKYFQSTTSSMLSRASPNRIQIEPIVSHKKSLSTTISNISPYGQPVSTANKTKRSFNSSLRTRILDEFEEINAISTPSTVKGDFEALDECLDEYIAFYYEQEINPQSACNSTTPTPLNFTPEFKTFSRGLSPSEMRNKMYNLKSELIPTRSDTPVIPTKRDLDEKVHLFPEIKKNNKTPRNYVKSTSPQGFGSRGRRAGLSRKRDAISPLARKM